LNTALRGAGDNPAWKEPRPHEVHVDLGHWHSLRLTSTHG
jgi:hypothetical protein